MTLYNYQFNGDIQVGQFRVRDPESTKISVVLIEAVWISLLASGAVAVRSRERRMIQEKQDRAASKILEAATWQKDVQPFYARPFLVTNRLGVDNPTRSDSPLRLSYYDEARNIDLETALERALRKFGSLVALGRPGEHVGAGRVLSTEEEWRQAFGALAAAARLVFIIPSTRDGTMWEIASLRDHGLLSKSVFLMPPALKRSRLKIAGVWNDAVTALCAQGVSLPAYTREGRLFKLDESGHIAVECSLGKAGLLKTCLAVARSVVRGQIRGMRQAVMARRDPLAAAIAVIAG